MSTKNKSSITVVLGTARKGRQSEKVAKAIVGILKKRKKLTVRFVDVKDYIFGKTIPPWEENKKTKPWRDLVKKTDGFIIVTPEYNHGYPGELKMLLDQELKGYVGKSVVVCGCSSGWAGGLRVVENLLPVFRELGLLISYYSLYVTKVGDFPSDLKAVDEKFMERVNKAADHLIELTQP